MRPNAARSPLGRAAIMGSIIPRELGEDLIRLRVGYERKEDSGDRLSRRQGAEDARAFPKQDGAESARVAQSVCVSLSSVNFQHAKRKIPALGVND